MYRTSSVGTLCSSSRIGFFAFWLIAISHHQREDVLRVLDVPQATSPLSLDLATFSRSGQPVSKPIRASKPFRMEQHCLRRRGRSIRITALLDAVQRNASLGHYSSCF